ncbi:MAG TPA: hypothetical protein DCL21_04080 [Alphaproteobacteria bacterium]|nr:hypothetical protein [Alphaproteobacteria bacterium]
MIKTIYLVFILTLLGCSANQSEKKSTFSNIKDSALEIVEEGFMFWGLDDSQCPKNRIRKVTLSSDNESKAIVTEKCLNVYFKIINLTKNAELQCKYIYGLKSQTRYVDPDAEFEVTFERYIGNSEVTNPGFDYRCETYEIYN